MNFGSAVKYQMKRHGNDLKEGDVLMTNSPHAGGSQVPFDLPVFLLIVTFLALGISQTSP
jgi:N-methylhydantoinase B/oxoprolinase/acetone carboxylase alpha subunit